MHQQNIRLGVMYGAFSALFFTLLSLFVKIIGDRASIPSILFFRFSISLLLLLPFTLKDFKKFLKIQTPLKFILRSVFNLLTLACFFYALKQISFTNALVLVNTAPLFVPICAYFMLKIKTHSVVWFGILIGFLGILLILKPNQGVLQTASIIGLFSGIFAALSILMIRLISRVGTINQILFYNFLVTTCISGIASIFMWKPFDLSVFYLLLGAGIVGALYQFCITQSYAKSPVRISSSFMFLGIVFGAIAEWLIWGQVPGLMDLLGMVLVIAGGIWVVYFGQKFIRLN